MHISLAALSSTANLINGMEEAVIKFIIETVTSSRDVNGNCYHVAAVTRTDTRECFRTDVGGEQNALFHARRAGLEYNEVYNVQCVIPKKQFKWISKDVKYREPELEAFFRGEIKGEQS